MKIKVCILTRDKFRYIGILSTLRQDGELALLDTSDWVNATDIVASSQPDVLILDITTVIIDLPTFLKECKHLSPHTRILTIGIVDDDDVVHALHAGVRGYLNIVYFADELIEAIKAVHQGSAWITGRLMGRLIDEIATKLEQHDKSLVKKGRDRITEMENKVLWLLASEGLTNKEIAGHLSIEERTVEFHITNLLRKFELANRNRLIIYAIKYNLVPLKSIAV